MRYQFRVWNVMSKKMMGWGEIFDLPAWEIFPGTPEQRPFNVMQYTGLKDKDGKEIYEGDVILVIEWNRKYKVVFERGMFKASGSTTFSLVTATNGELSCQVIGNIYENPELVKN